MMTMYHLLSWVRLKLAASLMTAGEAGGEEGGVRGEDEEPGGKAAEEKRASVEAARREAILKYEDMAAKHRSKGTTPATKFLGCF